MVQEMGNTICKLIYKCKVLMLKDVGVEVPKKVLKCRHQCSKSEIII